MHTRLIANIYTSFMKFFEYKIQTPFIFYII